MSPNPWDSGRFSSSVTGLKGDFQPFFLFFFDLAKERCLALPTPCSGGLAAPPAPPRAQAPAPLPWLFLPARITSERVTFPQGRCRSGGTVPASVPGVPVRLRSGCFPAASRLSRRRRQPARRVLEGLLMA